MAAWQLIIDFDPALFRIVILSLNTSLVAVVVATVIALPLGFLIGLGRFYGRRMLLGILNTLMALPTVIIALLLYGVLNRQGLLGDYSLLYTPVAITLGQAVLILPLITNLAITAIVGVDPRLALTCQTLGANFRQRYWIWLQEARYGLLAAVVVGFGRAIGEVGVAMILGGNIEGYTRTMTTAIALETSKGNFEFALALGLLLLAVAFLVNIVLHLAQDSTGR